MHWKSNDSILENVFIMHNSVPVYMWNKLFSLEFLRGNNLRCIHSYVEDDFLHLGVYVQLALVYVCQIRRIII